jgi:diadenosine tetraphosphate (Ap4A) HIT family hydrolase
MIFELHPNLANKIFIKDLPLCQVLMEDEKNYPWFFLVPRRPDVLRIMDLSAEDQLQLLKELDLMQKVLWEAFQPTQLNVAAIGNKTAQLHVHVIARYDHDPAWPATVWDHPSRCRYDASVKNEIIQNIAFRLDCAQL